MNRRLVTVFLIAAMIATVTTVLLFVLMRGTQRGPQAAAQSILVASRDLNRGELLRDVDFKTVSWNAPALPKGAFNDKAALTGRGVISEMSLGEPILESRLAPREAGAGLAPSIPVGKRAVSLRVNDVVAVAGFVRPGSRIDVLITGNIPGQQQQGPELRTILQNIEVLSAGADYQRDAEGKPKSVPVITLLVTPEEAETLSLASNETRIQLVLRNPMDSNKTPTPGTALAQLFRGGPPPQLQAAASPGAGRSTAPTRLRGNWSPKPPPVACPPPPPNAGPIVVEVIKGGVLTKVPFS